MSGAYSRADSAAKVVGEHDASGAVTVAVHVEVDGLRPGDVHAPSARVVHAPSARVR